MSWTRRTYLLLFALVAIVASLTAVLLLPSEDDGQVEAGEVREVAWWEHDSYKNDAGSFQIIPFVHLDDGVVEINVAAFQVREGGPLTSDEQLQLAQHVWETTPGRFDEVWVTGGYDEGGGDEVAPAVFSAATLAEEFGPRDPSLDRADLGVDQSVASAFRAGRCIPGDEGVENCLDAPDYLAYDRWADYLKSNCATGGGSPTLGWIKQTSESVTVAYNFGLSTPERERYPYEQGRLTLAPGAEMVAVECLLDTTPTLVPIGDAQSSASPSPTQVTEPPETATPSPSTLGDLNEVQAQQYEAILDVCSARRNSLRLVGDDGHGLNEWVWSPAPSQTRTAFASGEYHAGVSVESCGDVSDTNGVSVPDLHDAVIEAAREGWGLSAEWVMCETTGDGWPSIFDVVAPGPSAGVCTVWDGDGNQAFAFIDITPSPPHFRVVLGE